MVIPIRFISVPTNSSDKTNIQIVRSTVAIYESNNNETPVIFFSNYSNNRNNLDINIVIVFCYFHAMIRYILAAVSYQVHKILDELVSFRSSNPSNSFIRSKMYAINI